MNPLAPAEFEDRLLELKEWNGNHRTSILKILMQDTRPNRKQWLKGKPMAEVISTFPTFTKGNYVTLFINF